MEKQPKFVEKILFNMIKNLSKSFAYERAFNQVLTYRGYLFSNSGEWYANILAKQLDAKKARKEASKFADEMDFPIPPCEYLTESDVQDAMERLLQCEPHLSEPFPLEKNVVLLGDLLELSEAERLILQMATYGGLTYPYDGILSSVTYATEFDEPGRIYEVMFGLSPAEVKKTLQGFLFNSGLVIPQKRYRNLHSIVPELSDTFSDANISAQSISESIFPSCLTTDLTLDEYPHVEEEIARAETIIQKSLSGGSKGINVMFWGIPGTGKTELTLALAKKNGWDLKVIGDSSKLDMSEKSRAQRLTSLKIAMKLYQNIPNTVLLFDEMEDLFKQDNNATFSKAFINRIIETTPIPIIWTTNSLYDIGSAVLRRMTYNIGFKVPPSSARKKIWQGYTKKYGVDIPESIIDDLALNYDIAPALINNAVKIAKMADLEDQDAISDIVKSLDTLVHYGAKRNFQPVKQGDTPYNTDWVNSKTNITTLTGQLMSAKPNFSLLLYGAPGTGKSEFARHLAHKMGRAVLYKRASDLQSMWVGECEKNIAAMFEEAKREEKFIILDEGDTFLQNRETAQRSWEVSQVNEMLSQIENHTHPFCMTTNMMANLDAAAMRRFVFKMEFKFLRTDQARAIFAAYFGVEAPEKLDKLDCLAPGDFAAVKKRADIIDERDPVALYELLLEELELKPQFQKLSMGFAR